MNTENEVTHVLFDHDGGIDDLLSLLLLLRLPNIKVVGICITPADCYPQDALLSTLKILKLTNNEDIPVSVGTIAGLNPFPPEWRAQPKIFNALPLILRTSASDHNISQLPAHEFISHLLETAKETITILMTGPATNLAKAIEITPSIKPYIDEVIWMGGAIEVKGNVAMHDHDQSAEWNAYWDPMATKNLIESNLNLCLVPLDATNLLPVNTEFLTQLANKNTPVSELCGQLWAATVTAIPSYEFTYFLWDVLSTCVLCLPSESTVFSENKISVSTREPSAGSMYIDDNGTTTRWLKKVDPKFVMDLVTHYLSGEFEVSPEQFLR